MQNTAARVVVFGEIDIPFWSEEGFRLAICEETGSRFWTRDQTRTTSGDTQRDPYTFIGKPIISGYDVRGSPLKDAMRHEFLTFFEDRGHKKIAPYPVVARWRDDIHLTIASIADFQPHVTSGKTPPPANPLTISQPCIRLTDVAAVGRSGRHLTTFEMMAHHAFNREASDDFHYWIDKCVRLCDELLTESFGIIGTDITYVENPWSGGGNAGAALEVIVGGLELATLVFMDLEEHPEGDTEIKGLMYRKMDQKIIDTGYGLERFCWAAAGTPTIYEAVYPETVSNLRKITDFDNRVKSLGLPIDMDYLLGELSRLAGILNIDVGTDAEKLYVSLAAKISGGKIQISVDQLKEITEPLSLIYAIPDHLQAVCSMLGDGLVPSNSKAGYLPRMLARRVCRMKAELGINLSLAELGQKHIDNHMRALDKSSVEGILLMLKSEEEKYNSMLQRGRSAVKTALKDIHKNASSIDDQILIRLAEERGIQPDMTLTIARESGWENLEIRVGFSAEMAARSADRTKQESLRKASKETYQIQHDRPTVRLFDQDPDILEFKVRVVFCEKIISRDEEGSPERWVVALDQSAFYPTSGGQECDLGWIENSRVTEVTSEKGIILHYIETELPGSEVTGRVDRKRRKQITQHHSAVHVVGGSARKVLGQHVWQAGSYKSRDLARLDITHFERLTRAQLDQIEDHANLIVESSIDIDIKVVPRSHADEFYGFTIYQGGAPKHDRIRIVDINGHDTQACGGTHVGNTSEISDIRLVRSSQVQDGVERLVVMAGEAAREHARQQTEILTKSADILGVQPEDLPKAVDRFFREWKDQRKTIENLRAEVTRIRAGGDSSATNKDGVRYVLMEMEGEFRDLMSTLGELTRDPQNPTVAILASRSGGGKIVVAITEDTIASKRHNAATIVKAMAPSIKGSGGGKPTMAQASGKDPEGMESAMSAARSELGI